mgnify:FL=1
MADPFKERDCEIISGTGSYRFNEKDCPANTQCFNGNCETFGCGTTNDINPCSTVKDANGEDIEGCTGNACVETDDKYKATLTDLLLTKCDGDTIMKVQEYTGSNDNKIYRWVKDADCTGDTPVCLGDQIS